MGSAFVLKPYGKSFKGPALISESLTEKEYVFCKGEKQRLSIKDNMVCLSELFCRFNVQQSMLQHKEIYSWREKKIKKRFIFTQSPVQIQFYLTWSHRWKVLRYQLDLAIHQKSKAHFLRQRNIIFNVTGLQSVTSILGDIDAVVNL